MDSDTATIPTVPAVPNIRDLQLAIAALATTHGPALIKQMDEHVTEVGDGR